MNGLPYYKAYPRDFIEGTIGMPFEIKCAYRVVLDLIYMQGGELPDDPRYISGLLGCSIRKWKTIRNALVEMGKIQVSGEFLTNYRAVSELETLAKLQDKQRENRTRPNKNNNLQKPRSDHTEPEPEPDKETIATAMDAGGVARSGVWKNGLSDLISLGLPDRAARSAIGKWCKANGQHQISEAISDAVNAGTGDPVAYIEKILSNTESEAQNGISADRKGLSLHVAWDNGEAITAS